MTEPPPHIARDDAPVMDVDLYSAEILADPWPTLTRIREAGPLVRNSRGFWMTARDRVCRQILNRPGQLGQEGMISAFFGRDAFISIDDRKAHDALRNVWVSSFQHGGVVALQPLVERTVGAMLDAIVARLDSGEVVDLMVELCRPLPTYVIAAMLGVSDDMVPAVIRWSDLMGDATLSGFPIDYANDIHWLAAEGAKVDLAGYILEQMAYRRAHPGDDLISRIVHSEVAKGLSDEAIMVNTRQLLFAGNETTAKWLGHILLTFARRPDVRAAVAEDLAKLPRALNEIMRWQGVTQVLPRGVRSDGAVVEGIALDPGEEVTMLLGGANRDPDRYDDPDTLRIDREPRPHLGFGFGMHSCLGAVLARMEAVSVATAVLDRMPAYTVAEPVAYGNFSLRGPAALPAAKA